MGWHTDVHSSGDPIPSHRLCDARPFSGRIQAHPHPGGDRQGRALAGLGCGHRLSGHRGGRHGAAPVFAAGYQRHAQRRGIRDDSGRRGYFGRRHPQRGEPAGGGRSHHGRRRGDLLGAGFVRRAGRLVRRCRIRTLGGRRKSSGALCRGGHGRSLFEVSGAALQRSRADSAGTADRTEVLPRRSGDPTQQEAAGVQLRGQASAPFAPRG